jgi:ferredoxin
LPAGNEFAVRVVERHGLIYVAVLLRTKRNVEMAFVVTDNCRRCRFTDCVDVCPVDCFHGDAEMLYIDPEECIDCGACVPECPVEAIYDETQLPDALQIWTLTNKERAKSLPVINETSDPLPTAEARKKELGF